jgi:hypothetical protein
MKIMKLLMILYVIPFVIIPIYFRMSYPLLFEISGFSFINMEKMNFSYFCFPVIGLLLSIICIKISSFKLSEYSIIFNKVIMMSIFVIITIKFGFPSMKNIFYLNYNNNFYIIYNNIINNITTPILKFSFIILCMGIYFYIKYEIPISEYKYNLKNIF